MPFLPPTTRPSTNNNWDAALAWSTSPIGKSLNTCLSFCPQVTTTGESHSGVINVAQGSIVTAKNGTILETRNIQSCVAIAVLTDKDERLLSHSDDPSQIRLVKQEIDNLNGKITKIEVCGGKIEEASKLSCAVQACKNLSIYCLLAYANPVLGKCCGSLIYVCCATGASGLEVVDSFTRSKAEKMVKSIQLKDRGIELSLHRGSQFLTHSMKITVNGEIVVKSNNATEVKRDNTSRNLTGPEFFMSCTQIRRPKIIRFRGQPEVNIMTR
jgi:hypothetical protein